MNPVKVYYLEDRPCERCEKNTLHRCHDSNHERDSSEDYQECLICRWYRFGFMLHSVPPADKKDFARELARSRPLPE